jgi:predicted RNase H-like HicB family nuclease
MSVSTRYAVIIEKAADNYSAYVPDLPGCIAAGDTIDETVRLIAEAMALHIHGMKEDGLEVPEPTSLAREVEVDNAFLMRTSSAEGEDAP